MFSIDQNCHSLWDVIPKLKALAGAGYSVSHFVEDIDVAFTSLGADADGGPLRLATERFHRSGGQDWGAALFYCEFLGKLPVEIRHWQAVTGMKTSVLAKQLGRSVDELYDEFSPGDNWQLIGPSYAGDRDHHRVVADLSADESAEFLRRIMGKARADMLRAFPGQEATERLIDWFDVEQARLERLIGRAAGGRLVDVYCDWLREYLGETVKIGLTSQLFSPAAGAGGTELLDLFCRDYDTAAGLYNQALDETRSEIRPLKTAAGELPFFATFQHRSRLVRAGLLLDGRNIRVGRHSFTLGPDGKCPLDAMASAGIMSVAGKAIVMIIQVRLGPGGRALALPYRGSLYMPAADAFAEKLATAGLIGRDLQPVVRVRFHLLDRMKSLRTVIRLPEHLAGCFGRDEIPACELANSYRDLAREAADRLEAFTDARRRLRWQRENFGDLTGRIDQLDRQRRQLAQQAPKSQQIRDVWKQMRSLNVELLDKTLRRIAADWQMREIDYWDSRGALLPACIALGGESFYNELIAKAEIYAE